MRKLRRIAASLSLVIAAAALLAVAASPAAAAVHWNDTTHGAKLSGSLTVSKKGEPTKTCTASAAQYSNMGTDYMNVGTTGKDQLEFACAGGGTFGMVVLAKAKSTSSIEINFPYEWSKRPWDLESFYKQNSFGGTLGDFVNGSGATPSKLTFVNDEIGRHPDGWPILLNGTLNVTTSTGGLLTLLP